MRAVPKWLNAIEEPDDFWGPLDHERAYKKPRCSISK